MARPFTRAADRLPSAVYQVADRVRIGRAPDNDIRRERVVGLAPSACLGAKLAVFALVNTAQAALFALIGLWGRARPEEALLLGSPTLELIAVIALVTLTSTVLGLLVSAYVSTSEQTMPVLVGFVMAQLVLCGGLFAVAGRAVIAELSWLAPARWAYAAMASTVDLKAVMVDPPDEVLWEHTTFHWLLPVGTLVAQTLVLLVATRLAMRRHDPAVSSWSMNWSLIPEQARGCSVSRKKTDPALDAALQAGWASACRLYEHLLGQGGLVSLPPSALRLNPGEVGYGEGLLGYARFYGMNVTYNQSNSFWFGSAGFIAAGLAADAIGNASARSRAQRMAASQWRDHAQARTMLTNRRLMCDYQNNWLSFWHEGVVEFACDLQQWSFVLRYQQGDPLMLHGPAAPWFAVAVAYTVYGPQGMLLPAFAPLAQATAHRRQAITGEVVHQAGAGDQRALPGRPTA